MVFALGESAYQLANRQAPGWVSRQSRFFWFQVIENSTQTDLGQNIREKGQIGSHNLKIQRNLVIRHGWIQLLTGQAPGARLFPSVSGKFSLHGIARWLLAATVQRKLLGIWVTCVLLKQSLWSQGVNLLISLAWIKCLSLELGRGISPTCIILGEGGFQRKICYLKKGQQKPGG